jgi:hypothetical protein
MLTSILIAILAALVTYAILKAFLGDKTSFAGLEPNTFQSYDPLAVCPGLHKWQEVQLVFKGEEPPKKVLVCVACGSVSGYDTFMLTKNALDAVKLQALVIDSKNIILEEQVKTADKILEILENIDQDLPRKQKILKIVTVLTDYESNVVDALDRVREKNK